MGKTRHGVHEQAVLFIEQHKAVRQFRYSEFESLLDGYFGIRELAETEAHAVYVTLNEQLHITAAVFFLLYFDEQGRADAEWNVPIEELAVKSASGPDLGAGPIRLACRSQCAIAWHQKQLWDPELQPGSNDLIVLQKAVAENKLGLEAKAPAPEPEADAMIPTLTPQAPASTPAPPTQALLDSEALEQAHRDKIAQLLRQQRLQIKALNNKREDDLAEVERQHRLGQQSLRNDIQDLQQNLEQARVMNEQLKRKLATRYDEVLEMQEGEARYKSRISELERALIERQQQDDADETANASLDKVRNKLVLVQEQLDRRELELYYKDERVEQLQAELTALRDRAEQINEGQSGVLRKMTELDLVSVAFHPGAGHLTIPPAHLGRYLDNPVAYAAEKCQTNEAVYVAWLAHHEAPVCQHESAAGEPCGKPVATVAIPSDFVPGISDHCDDHQR